MPEIAVFAGPTIPADRVRAALPGRDVAVLPPAGQGDVAELVAAERPRVVAVVDGVYERVPAVWHKEILWAMSEGVAVAGAASMGALRAAELAPYGMTGVGEVYRAFVTGELTDDDEVAVAHLDADQGYRPVNEAMVTIRATLRAAVAEGVIPGGEAAGLVAAAKDLHYPDRRWPRLLAGRATPLRDWLPTGRRDVKRADALALLGLLAVDAIRPAGRAWHFERTSQWRAVQPVGRTSLPPAVAAAVLDGLRAEGGYDELERAATLRLVAAATGARPHGAALDEWIALVSERVPAADLADLTPAGLAAFAADQACLVAATTEVAEDVPAAILDTLRVRGEYAARVAPKEKR
ncbi:TfuA-like protein [Herbidospora cretacea]|uniref:TfuA-like protein n=1 Tax=Herbidospora cretacea TaxID=28444 RepID=UPI00068A4302|nr:TfuA-like protein [Herbidospora cretacea]